MFVRLVGGNAEHVQQVFGDLVGGLGVVAVRLVVQRLAVRSSDVQVARACGLRVSPAASFQGS